jgi:hypothetical protein
MSPDGVATVATLPRNDFERQGIATVVSVTAKPKAVAVPGNDVPKFVTASPKGAWQSIAPSAFVFAVLLLLQMSSF